MRLVAPREAPHCIAEIDKIVHNADLADMMTALVEEGPGLFYSGELAQRLARDCNDRGGHLCVQDLAAYRVLIRKPLRYSCHGADFSFNSPPSPSGCLVAFALGLLEERDLKRHRQGHPYHCLSLGRAMQAASRLRRDSGVSLDLSEHKVAAILEPGHLASWRASMLDNSGFSRGTTQLSVADGEGNLASLTVSNGEGCAYVLPGTGIMLNNMLGEEDLNPGGFHHWTENRRMASMMCPSVASLPDGGWVALGSGGSNRIRSAILQVLINMYEFDMSLEDSVNAPRLHLEGDHLSVESGFDEHALEAMQAAWPDYRYWPEPNMFFGGVHAVERHGDGRFRGAGDPRRGGSVAIAGDS